MFKDLKESTAKLLLKAGAHTQSGVAFFKGKLGSIALFSSSATLTRTNIKFDETHYILIPDRESQDGYILYTKRVLPDGISTDNNLPKKRVFQLPSQAALDDLEALIFKSLKDSKLNDFDTSSPLAERLDKIADEIDRSSNIVTGGLILVGGVIAVANPLLGIGVAAKALFPSIGGKLTSHGVDHFSSFLKKKKTDKAEKHASKSAKKELKTLKPEIRINTLLETLNQILYTTDPEHDPLIDGEPLFNDPKGLNEIIIIAEAITVTYGKIIEQQQSKFLHKNDYTWLESLSTLHK